MIDSDLESDICYFGAQHMGKIKQLLFILAATSFLAACAQHPSSYQGPAAPKPQDLPPPTNLFAE